MRKNCYIMEELLQKIIDLLEDYKDNLKERKEIERAKSEKHRWTIVYINDKWYREWFDRWDITIADALKDYLKEHRIDQIVNILKD